MAVNKSKIVEQAQKYTAKGQFDKAIAEYLRVVKAEPGDIRTWLKIGDLYTRKGSRKEATDTYLKVADHYTKNGFYLKAVAVYKQILKLDPTLLEVHELLAKSYMDLGLSSEALIQLEQLADMYQRTGRTQEMLNVLLRMGEIDPHNIATRLRIAEHLSKEERIPEAVENFAAACNELRAQGRADDYVKVAERLLYHDSTRVAVAREVARIYVERGQYKRALSRLQLCFIKDPRDLPTLELLARAFHGLEQPEKAISVYGEMAAIQKDRGEHAAYAETMRNILNIDPRDATARAAVERAGLRPPSQPPSDAPRLSAQPLDGLWSPADALSKFAGETTSPSDASIDVHTESQSAPSPTSHANAPQTEEVAQQLSEAEIDERSNKIISETEVLLKYGLKARACEHLRRVFDLDPYNIDAREKLKDLLLELGSVDEALDQLFLLADVFKESQPEGSVYYLHEILKIDPSNRLARQLLSDLGGVMPEELREEPATTSLDESTYVGPQKRERKEDSGVAELELDDIDESIPGMNETTAPERHKQDEGIDLSLQDLTLQDEFFESPLTGPTGESDVENVHLSDFAEIGAEDAVVDSTGRKGDIPDLSGEVMVADEDEGEYVDEEEVMIEDDGDEDNPVVSSERLPVPLGDGPATREYDELYVMGQALENGKQAQERDPHYSEPPTGRHSMAEILAAEAARVREVKGSAPVSIPDSPSVDLAAIDSWHMPPEERADPSVPAKTAPPPPDLSAEAAEVEFFLDQNLFDEAVQIIDDLERSYPGHPTLAALRGRLPACAASALPLEQTDSERSSLIAEGLFDAADFSDSLAEDPMELGRTSLAENLSGQFRVEVKEQVDDTDFATHFDLGMAYKEMRLSDEAIKEFKIASGDPERAGQAQIMIGLCHVSAGDLDRAVKIFEEGLNSNGLPISDRLGLLYELGKLHEERSQVDLALTCYENIVAEDPAFADVVERINRLQ